METSRRERLRCATIKAVDAQPAGKRYPPWNSPLSPAPGDLRIVQAFVNTCQVDKRKDGLGSAKGLADWLARWGLMSGDAPLNEAEWRQAIELREGLRGLLLCNSGKAGDAERLRLLERALADLPLRCALCAEGVFDLVAVASGWTQAAARMLTVVTRAMGSGRWRRLKACWRDDCQRAFYDSSKNRSGKWCAMAGCGDLMKARAYRRRQRRQRQRREVQRLE